MTRSKNHRPMWEHVGAFDYGIMALVCVFAVDVEYRHPKVHKRSSACCFICVLPRNLVPPSSFRLTGTHSGPHPVCWLDYTGGVKIQREGGADSLADVYQPVTGRPPTPPVPHHRFMYTDHMAEVDNEVTVQILSHFYARTFNPLWHLRDWAFSWCISFQPTFLTQV